MEKDQLSGVDSLVATLNSMVDLRQIDSKVAKDVLVNFCARSGDDLEEWKPRLNPLIVARLRSK